MFLQALSTPFPLISFSLCVLDNWKTGAGTHSEARCFTPQSDLNMLAIVISAAHLRSLGGRERERTQLKGSIFVVLKDVKIHFCFEIDAGTFRLEHRADPNPRTKCRSRISRWRLRCCWNSQCREVRRKHNEALFASN